MKKVALLLIFIGLVSAQQGTNPCEDKHYIEIMIKSIDDMSDREYEYFIEQKKKCDEYVKINSYGKNLSNDMVVQTKMDVNTPKKTISDNLTLYNISKKNPTTAMAYTLLVPILGHSRGCLKMVR